MFLLSRASLASLRISWSRLDTGGAGQGFHIKLAKEMNYERKIQFSVFCLDYGTVPLSTVLPL